MSFDQPGAHLVVLPLPLLQGLLPLDHGKLGGDCQRRSENASAGRSKNTSTMLARRPPRTGGFSSGIRLGSDYPPAYPSWRGVSCAYSD
jgi:hypothetical protein